MKMKLPERKPNPMAQYSYGQAGSYFVTLCTHNRARLFQMESSAGNGLCAIPEKENGTTHKSCPAAGNQIIHKWIRETENKFPSITIDKYVIMADHIHLIITIPSQHTNCSLPDIMRFFKTMTTNEYIRDVKAGILPSFDKKLWQKSYYDHVIRNQQDYNEIWEYIRNNPLKWELIHHPP